MSRIIDFDKPLSDEDKLWLHQWGYDYKIVENEQRFAQAKVHDAGETIDVAKVLVDAGLKEPVVQSNPILPAHVVATGAVAETAAPVSTFDEEAVRAEVADMTVAELRDNIRDLDCEPEGNKASLQHQLLELLRKIG